MAATFFATTWERFIELVLAPYFYQDMIWIIIPMLVTICIMEFYFVRYKHEELGWNTAVGNSIVLVFISIDLFRQIYQDNLSQLFNIDIFANLPFVTVCAGAVGLGGIGLLLFNFWHIIPKRLSFLISSSLPINTIAYVSIILVYSNMATDGVPPVVFDIHTILAAFLLMIVLFFFFKIVAVLLIPESKDIVEAAVATAREEIEKAAGEEKKKIEEIKERVEEEQESEIKNTKHLQEQEDYNNQ